MNTCANCETKLNKTDYKKWIPEDESGNEFCSKDCQYKFYGLDRIIWKTEEDQQKELQEYISNWKAGYSKDGFIIKGEGVFHYRGIAYLIRILRYFNHTDKFVPMSHRISDCHVVVEIPEETKEIKSLVNQVEENEFLYHDTLHSWNDNQTVEQQLAVAHDMARDDIDSFFDGEISKTIDRKIKNLNELKEKINAIRGLK